MSGSSFLFVFISWKFVVSVSILFLFRYLESSFLYTANVVRISRIFSSPLGEYIFFSLAEFSSKIFIQMHNYFDFTILSCVTYQILYINNVCTYTNFALKASVQIRVQIYEVTSRFFIFLIFYEGSYFKRL